ncbi:MAG: cyanophycin synthetase [Gemmatimonas sp.]|jgi:cyanophycin synthetase|uniref:cyanophycin synthetase n=1 Tax=Gemmatimonas sp. TaxID=1962908 RepID=UPI00391F540D|nr:cyanophycin synthetase [Gemmatimonadota bacterium]
MRILDRSVYVGPSHYAHFPVIRLILDLGALEAWPTRRLGDGFVQALLAALPGLHEHGCSYGEPGGFIRRMTEDEGTWLGHVLEHVAIELQNVAGAHVTFGKTRETTQPGVYDVVFEYEQEDVGLEAADVAVDVLQSLLPAELRAPDFDPAFDLAERRDAFIRYAQRRALGPSTASLVKAAEDRNIPWLRLNEQSLIQLGYGCRQQRIQATITGRTSHIAVELASDKEETNRILANLGLPVPKQRLVQTAERAVAAAERIGYPVVTKPYNGNHGRGVSVALMTPDDVRAGFARAQEISRSVIVESFITGHDHRLLVVNGELVAASKREPGKVVGDGVHTIAELVAIVNQDPRRGIGHEKVLTQLDLDAQALGLLEKKGYTPDTVPPAGEEVYLRLTANLSTGGTAADVTDVIHPDNTEMAARAIQAIGLDVGGVDFLTPDITQSYKDIGGAICEVNAAPGFRMHMAPSEGRPRDVAGKVIDMLFPDRAPSTIPIAAITGTNGKTTTSRLLAHIHKLAGKRVGLTTTDGVYIDGQRTVEGDMTGPTSARIVLSDPAVEVAVLETARGGLLRAGMAMRHVDVGAVLNIQPDHLGQKGIETLEQLAEIKRTVAEIATDTVVLNADDPHTLRMAAFTKAKHVCYVTLDPAHDLVREHIRAGGRAIALEAGVNGQMITIYDRGGHIPLLWTHLIPATLEGRATFNVQNAMFAAAMAFAMGVRLEDIRHGLRTFDTTFFQAPGRLNVYDEHPFKVLFDYGHNAHAVGALCDLVNRMRPAGRRLCVLSAPGDRRDEDIHAIAQVAASAGFDHYICRRDDPLRGRGEDEVPRMLADRLLAHGIGPDSITTIIDEQQAIEAALRMARPGDLLLIFADALARGWKQIVNFRPDDDALVLPAPRAARAVPRAAITESAPADDATPPRDTGMPVSRWRTMGDDFVLMHDGRGVILKAEASD